MKTITKLVSVILMLTLVLSLSVSALAVDINIEKAEPGSEYTAYQLLTAKKLDNGNIEYGVNPTYKAALAKALGLADNAKDSEILAKLDSYNAAGSNFAAVAETIYNEIKGIGGIVSTDGKFEGLAEGYYLIYETKVGDGDYTAVSNVIVNTYFDDADEDGVINVTQKEGTPELEKKVDHNNTPDEGTMSDAGKLVTFYLTAKLPADISNYEHYYINFRDDLPAELTFDAITSVVGDPSVEGHWTLNGNKGDHHFEVRVGDLRELGYTGGETIVLTYTALVDASVESGKFINEADLEYTNDPTWDGTGTEPKGHTPKDTAVVVVLEFDTTKTDGAGAALAGAEFTLYKSEDGKTFPATGTKVAATGEGANIFEFTGLGEGWYKLEETKVPDDYNKAEDIYFRVTSEFDAAGNETITVTVTDKDGNPIQEKGVDVTFKVQISHTEDENYDETGTTVVNNKGVELPETGGIGTTIFYVIGGLLVAGAVILLVTKKRMGQE